MTFQMTFAIITPALITGAFADRMKFSAMILFLTAWSLLVYTPIAHWVWGGGFLGANAGVLDFAGGTVVHINAGVAGLVACIMVGKRKGYGVDNMAPHNLVLSLAGASLLWVGWFGFNAGSAVSSGNRAGMAMAVTQIATAAAALTWMFVEWALRKKPSVLGIISGAVAGLVAITPASGFVNPIGALVIGVAAGAACYWGAVWLKHVLGYDNSLDVFGVHGVGGIVGAVLTGVFADPGIAGKDPSRRSYRRPPLRQSGPGVDTDRGCPHHHRLVRTHVVRHPLRRQDAGRLARRRGNGGERVGHRPARRNRAVSKAGSERRHRRSSARSTDATPGGPEGTDLPALFFSKAGACPGTRPDNWRSPRREGIHSRRLAGQARPAALVPMLNPLIDRLVDYPFDRLRSLLADLRPPEGLRPYVLSVGEPRHAPPPVVAEALASRADDWGRYPPVEGTPEFRGAVVDWLARRYRLPRGLLDPEQNVLPVAGTREALFLIAQVVIPKDRDGHPPAVLISNPSYQVYFAAALFGRAEPVFVSATGGDGFCDLGSVDGAVLDRTALTYLCSPANPQGTVASLESLKLAVERARAHDFVLCVDECYTDIYDRVPPPGALQACAELGEQPGQRHRLSLAVETVERSGSALRVRGRRRTPDPGVPPTAGVRGRLCPATGAARLGAVVAG